MGFGKDNKISGFAKRGNDRRRWGFNSSCCGVFCQGEIGLSPREEEEEANYVLGTLNKQHCSTWTLLKKLDFGFLDFLHCNTAVARLKWEINNPLFS